MLASLMGLITRREGKKFLRLEQATNGAAPWQPPEGAGAEVSLYIHIPFCRTLCPFCCFNRYLYKEDAARAYFRSLRQELDIYISRGYTFSSVYFGGGTPTILMDELLGFIDYLKLRFPVREISLETTPHEINPRNIELLKGAGINRLSMGIQSFDDSILKAMGRVRLTGDEMKERVLMAQGHFDTLNLDFIFNFPFQSVAQFEADVAAFKAMGIDQATFYPLMPSPHKKDALERRFRQVDSSREKRFYDVILKQLYRQGYRPSTAWCFSRGDRMIDEYIVDYPDYVGIGAGSVGLVRGNFYVNSFALDKYGAMLQQDRLPVVRWRRLSEAEYYRYYLLTKLFGMGLDTGQFYRSFHADIHRKLGLELFSLKMLGLVRDGQTIRVTPRGMHPVSAMMREFFAALNGLREYCIERQI